jgi:hypothetical protein
MYKYSVLQSKGGAEHLELSSSPALLGLLGFSCTDHLVLN